MDEGVLLLSFLKFFSHCDRGTSSRNVAMVAEFLIEGTCHKQEAALQKVMALSKFEALLFRGAPIRLQEIRKTS